MCRKKRVAIPINARIIARFKQRLSAPLTGSGGASGEEKEKNTMVAPLYGR
jgi:hypothetical protein